MSLFPHEPDLLEKLRTQFKKLELPEDLNQNLSLAKWLRAQDHDLEKTESMLRKHLDWRKENSKDSILTWKPPAVVTKECPYVISGLDVNNSPIVAIPLGTWNIKKLVDSGQSFIRYCVQIVEKAVSKQKEVKGGQVIYMMDMAKLSMKTLLCPETLLFCIALNAIRQVGAILRENYPETLQRIYVYNPSATFNLLHCLVKPFMTDESKDKLKIYPVGDLQYKIDLSYIIPENQRVPLFGGSSKQKLELGSSNNDGESTAPPEDTEVTVIVQPGEILSVQYECLSPGAKLHYIVDILDKGHLYFWITANDLMVLATERFERTEGAESKKENNFLCCYMGHTRLIFDNGHDQQRAKRVTYRVNWIDNEPMDMSSDPRWPATKREKGHR